MNPSNFVIFYLSKFKKHTQRFILNLSYDADQLCNNSDVDYLSYDLIKHILPKNCLVIDSDCIIYAMTYKQYLLKNQEVKKFVNENKHVLFFEIKKNKIIIKGRTWSHYFDPKKVVLFNVLDEEYIIRRLRKLLGLRLFS